MRPPGCTAARTRTRTHTHTPAPHIRKRSDTCRGVREGAEEGEEGVTRQLFVAVNGECMRCCGRRRLFPISFVHRFWIAPPTTAPAPAAAATTYACAVVVATPTLPLISCVVRLPLPSSPSLQLPWHDETAVKVGGRRGAAASHNPSTRQQPRTPTHPAPTASIIGASLCLFVCVCVCVEGKGGDVCTRIHTHTHIQLLA